MKRVLSDVVTASARGFALVKLFAEALIDVGSEDIDRDLTVLGDPANKDLVEMLMIEYRKGLIKVVEAEPHGAKLVQTRCTLRIDELEQVLALRGWEIGNQHGLGLINRDKCHESVLTRAHNWPRTEYTWLVLKENGIFSAISPGSTTWIQTDSYVIVRDMEVNHVKGEK